MNGMEADYGKLPTWLIQKCLSPNIDQRSTHGRKFIILKWNLTTDPQQRGLGVAAWRNSIQWAFMKHLCAHAVHPQHHDILWTVTGFELKDQRHGRINLSPLHTHTSDYFLMIWDNSSVDREQDQEVPWWWVISLRSSVPLGTQRSSPEAPHHTGKPMPMEWGGEWEIWA